MSERLKKYEFVSQLRSTILNDLEADADNFNELVVRYYTKTTSGGEAILWKVNDKHDGLHYTVSTGSVGAYRVNRTIVVNTYKHYVLTAKGVQYVKEQMMELALGTL